MTTLNITQNVTLLYQNEDTKVIKHTYSIKSYRKIPQKFHIFYLF